METNSSETKQNQKDLERRIIELDDKLKNAQGVYDALQEEHKKFSALLEASHLGISLLDLDGNILFANRHKAEMLGFESDEQLLGVNAYNFLPPAERRKFEERYHEFLEHGSLSKIESELVRRDGTVFPVELNFKLISGNDGKPQYIADTFSDISERKIREAKQTAERDKLNFIMETTKTHYNIIDKSFNLHHVDFGWQKIYGDFKGRKCYEYFMGTDCPCSSCGVPKALATKKTVVSDEFLPRENRSIEVHTIPFICENGDWMVAEFNFDITERKKAIECEKQSYRLISIAGETARFGGWSVDLATDSCTWSDLVADIHEMPRGYSPKLQEGLAFYAPEWQDRIIEVYTRCAKEGIPYDEEMQIITKTGKKVWVRTVGRAERDEEGNIIRTYGSFQEIGKQKEIEKALEESERKYRTLFNEMPDSFALHRIILNKAVKPVDYTFLDVNPAFERMTGLKKADITGKTVKQVLPETEDYWIEMYGKVALTGEALDFENYSAALNKHFHVTAFRFAPLEFVTLFSDITRIKQTEIQLREQMSELQRFNKITVGRELKMIELKKEINKLLEKCGEKPIYKIPEI